MDDFIKKIFEIDEESVKYQSAFEDEKNKVIQELDEQIRLIDEQYEKVLQEEKENLISRLNYVENQDKDNLEKYKKKAEKIKTIFLQKKLSLLDDISRHIFEGGD